MHLKSLNLLIPAILCAVLTACGSGSDEDNGDVQGLAVAGSSYSGMVLAAVNIDPGIKTSRVYYYEFANGNVHELFPGEGGNPALFFADGRAFLFNREEATKNVRVFDPKAADATAAASIPLPDMALGDPWDLAPLTPGKTVALAALAGESVQILDYTTGTLESIAEGTMRPRSLMRSGSKLYSLHAGLVGSGGSARPDGTQRIDQLAIGTDGSLSVTGPALPLAGDNPTGFVNRAADGANATVVGLCAPGWTDCNSGASGFSGGAVKSYPFQGTQPPVYLYNQVVDGPAADQVYAHVQTGDGQPKVVRLDLTNSTATAVHTSTEQQLNGIAFDQSSRTLFVGDRAGLKGSMTLYRDDKAVGSFELDGVLYASAFVP